MSNIVQLLDTYAKLNNDLGAKQTFFYEFYKGRYDTLDAFVLDREIKDMQEKIKISRDIINEQLESKSEQIHTHTKRV